VWCAWSEISAVLAFVKFGSVKVSAFLLSAVLSVARNGFRGRIVKDLLATLQGPLAARAIRIKFCGNPFWIIGIVIGFHRGVCGVCVGEAGISVKA
jgi:hypothetical protein